MGFLNTWICVRLKLSKFTIDPIISLPSGMLVKPFVSDTPFLSTAPGNLAQRLCVNALFRFLDYIFSKDYMDPSNTR